jgi:uncharacterized protein (UPF0332 family)
MSDEIISLVEYRLKQARETLDGARQLLASGQLRDAVNRAYYTMFYAALALLASLMLGSSKHSGIMSLFGQNFIKTGLFSKETGRFLRRAFELRQKSDYQEFVFPNQSEVNELVINAEEFVNEAERVWQRIKDG